MRLNQLFQGKRLTLLLQIQKIDFQNSVAQILMQQITHRIYFKFKIRANRLNPYYPRPIKTKVLNKAKTSEISSLVLKLCKQNRNLS